MTIVPGSAGDEADPADDDAVEGLVNDHFNPDGKGHDAWEVREGQEADNPDLVALSVACPMEGDIALASDRAPDFFVLNRLESEVAADYDDSLPPGWTQPWRAGVVQIDDRVVGCIAVALRRLHHDGRPTSAMYVSDLKVLPQFRGQGVGDALSRWATKRCLEAVGPTGLVVMTVLGGNQAMEKRFEGPRGLPRVHPLTTIRAYSLPLLLRRRLPGELSTAPAAPSDLAEMADLWRRWAPSRQLRGCLDEAGLDAFINAAPGLDYPSYLLVRDRSGRLVGLAGVWDTDSFKRFRVTGYSSRLAMVRRVFNLAAPLVRATRLPAPGQALRNLSLVHLCVSDDRMDVARALVVGAANRGVGAGYSFLSLGLDVADPLASALKGLWAQPTDVVLAEAVVTGAAPHSFDGRPFCHEISLV
ncbi:MAG: GNAT family N-acetyltransferase [Acidimicrobiales bacterium]